MRLFQNPDIELNGLIVKKQGKMPRFRIANKRLFLSPPKGPVYFDYSLEPDLGLVVMPFRHINKEFPKYLGFTGEVRYSVLFGHAFFLSYTYNSDYSINVSVGKLSPGESVLLKDNHTFFNIGPKKLIVGYKLIEKSAKPLTEAIKYKGHPYYLTMDGILQNSNYLIAKTQELKKDRINVFNLVYR